MATFVFSVQGISGSPTGPDPENTVGDQDIGSLSRPFSSGLQVPVEPRNCRVPSKCPSIAAAEMSKTPH